MTSNTYLEDFSQSFITVLDFLWFRRMVKRKLAKLGVRCFLSHSYVQVLSQTCLRTLRLRCGRTVEMKTIITTRAGWQGATGAVMAAFF